MQVFFYADHVPTRWSVFLLRHYYLSQSVSSEQMKTLEDIVRNKLPTTHADAMFNRNRMTSPDMFCV
jgi:hypothetical protein